MILESPDNEPQKAVFMNAEDYTAFLFLKVDHFTHGLVFD